MMTPVEQHFVIEKPNANIFQLWPPTDITDHLGFPKRYSTFLYLKRLMSYRPKKRFDPTGIWTRTCQRQRFSLCKMLLERSHHSQKVKLYLVQALNFRQDSNRKFTSIKDLFWFSFRFTYHLSVKGFFFGNFSEVGGFPKTLHNFLGWSDENLILPYKGRYIVEKMVKTALHN